MKNFRKTIIALATVAAMLVPSVAMAATLTTTVDKDITGDVYVGFYDGAILKDVVKTTVDAITVDDAATAGEEETLPATVTITNEAVTEYTRVDEKPVYKLVFTAKADLDINSTYITLSYDDSDVELVSADEYMDDIAGAEIMAWETGEGKEYPMAPYKLATYGSGRNKVDFSNAPTKSTVVGDRVAASFIQQGGGTKVIPLDEGVVIFELWYRLEDGKAVDADTFKIETEVGAGTIHNTLLSDPGNEYGVKLGSKEGDMTYACYKNGNPMEDTIKLVTPWDAPVVTTKDLEVTVPTGAEGYKATMFIWDADQIAQCDPIALN